MTTYERNDLLDELELTDEELDAIAEVRAAITKEMARRRPYFYYGFFQCLEVVWEVAGMINCHLTTAEENALVDWMMFSADC